jgi:hypothetical protein
MKYDLEKMWVLIEEEIKDADSTTNRLYRRLDSDKDTGIRLGVVIPDKIREILIQIDENEEKSFIPPKWMGMRFEIISLDIQKRTRHIRLFLSDREHKSVFSTVCYDIVDTLIKVQDTDFRIQEFQNCIERWSRFFQKYGAEGLSQEMQRGLFGELSWLKLILSRNMNSTSAVRSWKGCRRNFHDFQYNGKVVEVKTTMTKEPRKVRINNEKQLDNQGFDFLYLFILTLQKIGPGGQKLPELVDEIRALIKDGVSSENLFESALREAGFLDAHASLYTDGYKVNKQEIFEVKSGFPRIIELPGGVGDIAYTITISACSDFELNIDKAINNFMER